LGDGWQAGGDLVGVPEAAAKGTPEAGPAGTGAGPIGHIGSHCRYGPCHRRRAGGILRAQEEPGQSISGVKE